jgi:hypothetical protein
MIDLMFEFIGDKILVRIEGTNIFFSNQRFGAQIAPIEGLRLDYNGVVREHPDLELKNNWREEAIKRFKEKIESLETENDRAIYIIEDLKKFGYKPLYKQEKGFRIEVIK